jgi:hypothetical protein
MLCLVHDVPAGILDEGNEGDDDLEAAPTRRDGYQPLATDNVRRH